MPKLFQMTEDKVASQIGISRDRIREIREKCLVTGIHFSKNGGAIVYTEDGVDRLVQELRRDMAVAMSEKGRTEPLPESHLQSSDSESALETLWVVTCCLNPTWVKARTASGKIVKCRVRRNVGLRMGQIIDKCEALGDGTYVCRGRW